MSHSVAQPSPASAPGATTPPSPENVIRALRVLIRPLVRLAIKAGVKYADLDELIRSSLIDEAKAQCAENERTNGSKLSMMTGLHRKEIADRLSSAHADSAIHVSDRPKQPVARQVFEKWAHEARKRSKLRRLAIVSNRKAAITFTRIVREIVTDVHPRSVLDELVRLGAVRELDGYVEMTGSSFTAPTSADTRLSLLSTNAGAMLRTSTENVLITRSPQLEQAIGGSGISLEAAVSITAIASEHWQKMRSALYDALVSADEVTDPGTEKYQIRIGTYANYEIVSKAP
jgi:hypothetical protein